MKLSVLIPARCEEYLSKTIEDILQNSSTDTEIIVGLDGQWAEPPIADNPRVTIVHVSESIGQRAMTNQLARLSKAKYVAKTDAHCAFDKDFDQKMLQAFERTGDNVVMVPVMRNLHIFNWVCPDGHIRYQGPSGPCKECGKPTVKDIVWIPKTNPQSMAYCFDSEPHFQYFNELKHRQSYQDQKDLTESMSLQGSFFMCTRDKYWELDLGDETFGSWGSQGIQVACSFWLSGGKVIVNHNTWYAHCFRTQGGDFGFPYPISGKQTDEAKKLAGNKLKDNKWPSQIHPSSWLIEKFWPVPGWSADDLIKIGGKVPVEEKSSTLEPLVSSSGSKGILYYTDNKLNMKLARTVRRQIAKSGLPITSVSLKPLDFGRNIHFKGERGYLTLYRQILTGLKSMKEDIVFFCEHDDLYGAGYFDFTPPDRNTFYYNDNYWFLRLKDGFAIHYNVSPLSGLCVYRDIAIKHFEERVALIEKEGFSYRMGHEPMTHHRIKWDFVCPVATFHSDIPTVDICHDANITHKRWSQDQFRRKPTFWEETQNYVVPGWNNLKELLK